MIHQQDPVGLITFDQKIRSCLKPQARRGHLGDMLSLLANLKPEGETDIAQSIVQVAAMLRHASLVMIFSDLLTEPAPVLEALYRLRHGGHDVILFHVLDEAEVRFPFRGMVELEDPESHPAWRWMPMPSAKIISTRSGPSGPCIAASVHRPESTTCHWTPACSSTGP